MALKQFNNLTSFIFLIFLLIASIGHAIIPSDKNSSPFHFIKTLEGCKKGNTTKGIQELKTYLKRFGYLNEIQANNDDFDHILESAIKTYQENFHINPSGIIDAETISSMMAPRCGVPDIVNGINHMQPRRTKHDSNSSSTHTVSLYSFAPGNPKWPPWKTHLTYKLLGNFPEVAKDPVALAFRQWAAASYFTFTLDQNSRKTDLSLGFYRRSHGDGHPFDGPNGVLAHSFPPTDGRLHFDLDEKWSYIFRAKDAYDIETVAAHEIGNLLGLGHSADPEALMYPKINPDTIKYLQKDDLDGITNLYHIK